MSKLNNNQIAFINHHVNNALSVIEMTAKTLDDDIAKQIIIDKVDFIVEKIQEIPEAVDFEYPEVSNERE